MSDLSEQQLTTLEELAAGAAEEAPEPVTVAFLVVQHKNGQWSAHSDWEELNIEAERKAHMDDFVAGAANVTASCMVQQSAMHTLIAMNQQAQAIQSQMEAQKIAQGLDLSHLKGKRS